MDIDTQRAMQISALLDGEVEAHEEQAAIRASLDDMQRWRDYLLIGESLRGESAPRLNVTEAVMARLAEEPVILAPRNLHERRRRPHPLLALAASVAGVAVVGWVALTGTLQPGGGSAQLAAAPGGPAMIPPTATLVNAVPATASEMQEYLLAHQAQAATVRLAEPARQIRSVVLTATHP
ncbi:sigma-E factor negative regulatory protein [Sulfuricystis multivorans]|uniref:sigma-E factor negative regulatory protein n=1 Tax=Sulfuricystis multivorans TaxID=2211108 RepID=UPI001558B6BD|nr:RseA family anti-sigma factor [Sulfuricystis multivorans]